jgi:hypothetical protein
MTAPAVLTLVGAGTLALTHLLYPLLVTALRLIRTGGKSPNRVGSHERVGTDAARAIEREKARIVVSPGWGGRLTPRGVRRLLAPLADEEVGLVVGRLLVPEVDESGRDGGREAALAQAERIHRGWTWCLASAEAALGAPAGLDGHPYAVRREFLGEGGGVNLARLARLKKRAVFLRGRRGLVGRVAPTGGVEELTARIVEEKRRGIRSVPKRAGNPAVLIRHALGNLTPLWLALAMLGSVLGLLEGGGWLYRLPPVLTGVFLLGTGVGGTVYNLGYRSRVYFPLWWLFKGVTAEVRAWLSPDRGGA